MDVMNCLKVPFSWNTSHPTPVFQHPSKHRAVPVDVNERFHLTGFAVVNSPFALPNSKAFGLKLKQYNPN